MQCHADSSYKKWSRIHIFAETKKIIIQCGTYQDCLQVVRYSREQTMTKQDNKEKKTMVQWSSLKIQSEIHIHPNGGLSFCLWWTEMRLSSWAMLCKDWWHCLRKAIQYQGSPAHLQMSHSFSLTALWESRLGVFSSFKSWKFIC